MTISRYKTNQPLVDGGFNQISGQTLTLSGNTLIANSGTFRYVDDMSSTYVARSLVDAEFVTGATSHIINIGSIGQVIYRGSSGITGATGFLFDAATSGVTAPNICISQTPPNDTCLDFILSWDDNSKQIHKIPYATSAGLTAACNGLSSSGGVVCLGGDLCIDTLISGGSNAFCINNEDNNIVIDNRSNGGIYLKSQSGICPYYNTFSNSVGFAIDYGAGFKIYDNRIGISQRGIEYDDNYSSFFSPRSLVDKSYVDAVASGLQPHTAVDVATTTNIELTGLTGTTIIDGIVVNDGYRVLVKDQDPFAEKNGIYVLTGTTLVRADDFNESSESVHGAYTFVLSGNTHANQSWVLSTPNPIIIDVTPLYFTLFNQVTNLVAGTGITISVCYGEHTISVDGPSLAGNSMSWNNSTCQFDVNVSGGTLSTALDNKLNISTFSGYTGTTRNELDLTITGATNGLTKSGRQIKLGGILTGATIVNGDAGAHSLTFNGLNNFDLAFNGTGTITDSNSIGIKYAGNYSSNYVARSLVDAAYVTGQTSSSGIQTASNGLTKTGTNVALGGTLNAGETNIESPINDTTDLAFLFEDTASTIHEFIIGNSQGGTSISSSLSGGDTGSVDITPTYAALWFADGATGVELNLSSDCALITGENAAFAGFEYAADYSANYVARSLVDAAYVTGQTSTSGIQTASNGLTKTGTNVELRGSLTKDTIIDGEDSYYFKLNNLTEYGLDVTDYYIQLIRSAGYSDKYFNNTFPNYCSFTCRSFADYRIGFSDSGSTKSELTIGITGMFIDDNICDKGLEYSNDYSANFTARSLVDAAYVTGQTGGGIQTASNGLTKTGTDVKLGGTLTATTTINNESYCISLLDDSGNGIRFRKGAFNSYYECPTDSSQSGAFDVDYNTMYSESYDTTNKGYLIRSENSGVNATHCMVVRNAAGTENGFEINGGTLGFVVTDAINSRGIEYGSDYSGNYTARSIPDVEYVTGQTSAGITTASNGLTKTGQDVALGGIINENTVINNTGVTYTFDIQGTQADDELSARLRFSEGYFDTRSFDAENYITTNGYTILLQAGKSINLRSYNASAQLTEFKINSVSGMIIQDNALSTGVKYFADYSTNFTARSLVDKDYVDTSAGAISGSNGLTRVDNNITLGGALTGTTTITGTFDLALDSTTTSVGGTLTLDTVGAGNVGTDDILLITGAGVVKKVAASTLGEDNNIYSKTIYTGNQTLTTGSSYVILVNHSAVTTITLPATPIDGQAFKIKDASAGGALTNNITIARNGNNIDRVASDALINTDGGALEFVYDSTLGWFSLAFVN